MKREEELCTICIKVKEREEMRVLKTVENVTKSRRPRTEPWENKYAGTKHYYGT